MCYNGISCQRLIRLIFDRRYQLATGIQVFSSRYEGFNKTNRTLRAEGGLRSAYWASLVLDYVAESVISLEDGQGDM